MSFTKVIYRKQPTDCVVFKTFIKEQILPEPERHTQPAGVTAFSLNQETTLNAT